MTPLKRKHHYIPEFYLAGFTPSGSKTDLLTVLDIQTGTFRESTLNGVAFEKDLYRVDYPNVPADVVEDGINELVEGPMAQVIKRITATALPLANDDWLALLRFVALLAVRVPRIRKRNAQWVAEIEHFMADMMFGSPERFARTTAWMRRKGFTLPEDADPETTRQDLLTNPPALPCGSNFYMEMMLKEADALVPVLAQRKWTLFMAEAGAGDFICSDSPVAMTPTDPAMRHEPMGFACPWTAVTVPLSRSMALFGQWKGASNVVNADQDNVAFVNQRTAAFAHRNLYASGPDFLISRPNGEVISGREFCRF